MSEDEVEIFTRVHHWQTSAGERAVHIESVHGVSLNFVFVCVCVSERMWQEVAEKYEKNE